jgi:hypothetical protein
MTTRCAIPLLSQTSRQTVAERKQQPDVYVYDRLRVQPDAHVFICILYSSIFLLYMFRVLFAPILRSTNCRVQPSPGENPIADNIINIKMHIQEVGCGDMDWIELAQDRDRWRTLVNAVMNLRVP